MKKVNTSRVERLAKEGSWILLGQVITFSGSIVLIRVLTGYLDPTQYGQLALSLTAASLVNQVILGGITAGIGRYYSIAAEKRDLNGYMRATLHLLGYATLSIVVLSLILIFVLFCFGYSQWIRLLIVVLLFSVFNGYNATLNSIQNAARQRAIASFHSGLDAWLKIGLVVCFMLWLGTSSSAVIIGYACSSLLITISQLLFLRNSNPLNKSPINDIQYWRAQIWAFSLPFTIFGGFTWILQASDRWALQTFATVSDIGQYAVLYQLGYTPIALISGLAINLLGPILYQRSGDGKEDHRNESVHRIARRITNTSLFLTLVGFALTFALNEQIFSVLVGSEYRRSSHLLPWVVLAGGIFSSGQILALKLMSDLKSSDMITAKITTALIGSLLNIAGAAFAGVQGVISALVAFSVIYFAWLAKLAYQDNTNNITKTR